MCLRGLGAALFDCEGATYPLPFLLCFYLIDFMIALVLIHVYILCCTCEPHVFILVNINWTF